MSTATRRMSPQERISKEEAERRGARSRVTHRRPALGWQEHAECRGEDTELFFPLGTGEEHAEQIEDAKAVCRLDEVERDKLRRRQSRRAA